MQCDSVDIMMECHSHVLYELIQRSAFTKTPEWTAAIYHYLEKSQLYDGINCRPTPAIAFLRCQSPRGGFSRCEGYYICSAISIPLFQAPGKFV